MDQRLPSQSASQAVEHMQSRQDAEANSVQDQEQAWHLDKLRGGNYLGVK